MDSLSKFELEELYEILRGVQYVIEDDDVGITWELEDSVAEGLAMLRKALNINDDEE